jgi:hypothetical protein
VKTFQSKEELISFAKKFADSHIDRFEKDTAICLTGKTWGADQRTTHAYFPALMASIGFIDLFSGLYAGTLNFPKLPDLKSYAKRFLPPTYTDLLLTILYQCFRHKVAHLAHPYDVLDTSNNPDFSAWPSKRITWTVYETDQPEALRLEQLPQPVPLQRAPSGWGVVYDHRVHVSLPRLAQDAIASVRSTNGFLDHLNSDQVSQSRFEGCMNQYFSP